VTLDVERLQHRLALERVAKQVRSLVGRLQTNTYDAQAASGMETSRRVPGLRMAMANIRCDSSTSDNILR
jgi:hypothetical protein